MSEKQSIAKSGEKNPRAKITAAIAAGIRAIAQKPGQKYGWKSALARLYGISPSTLDDILNNRTWGK